VSPNTIFPPETIAFFAENETAESIAFATSNFSKIKHVLFCASKQSYLSL